MSGTRLRRIGWICGGLVLVAVVALAALLFAFKLSFKPSAPAARYPSTRSALDAQHQDVDYFSRLMELDRAFSPAQRAEAQSRLAALAAAPEALPAPKLLVALMQVMALADNGHTRMEPRSGEGALILPLRVSRFEDGFYVMRTAGPYQNLLGGRVESIDGKPSAEILRRLETLRGGVEGLRRSDAARWIVMQDMLYGLGIATDSKSSVWTVRTPDGGMVTQTLTAYPDESGEWIPQSDRWLSPEPAEGVEHDWTPERPRSGETPETWRESDPFRVFSAGDGCIRVVRLGSISDSGGRSIASFLGATTADFRAHPPCGVILDLRGNGGGDYSNAWDFAHALPALVVPGGHISVLTDSLTFSAAITTAAFVKETGGDRVSIIGEPVGDRLAFFSEGGKGCLPHLKACVFYQRGKHDYAHACTDWRQCFWLNWFYPVRVRTLQPDVLVRLRFEDWDGGRDAAYLAALDAASNRSARKAGGY